mgnify:CR=1 FL=1
MIVDEEIGIVKQAKAILEKKDVVVVTVTNSRQAISRLIEENEETFDLILVNTRMPGSQKTNALFSMRPTVPLPRNKLRGFPPGEENA